MLREIGSNFWINPSDKFDYFREITPEDFGISGSDYAWLSTCRSAISLAIETIEQRNPAVPKIVLAPSFTCETVINPFLKAGYEINTYTVDSKLCLEGELLFKETKESGAGILILHRYFGFDTVLNIQDAISKIRALGVFVIEDRTQCLYSEIKPLNADFFVGSIRKWHGVPDGGFVVCEEGRINQKPLNCDEKLEKAKIDASYAKFRYLFKNTGEKEDFLEKYRSAESMLDHQSVKYKIGSFSYAMQASLDVKRLREKRKTNYAILIEGLKDIKGINIVFPELEEKMVPLYCPIIVEDRSRVQRVLGENAIFAPVIWPKSEALLSVCNAAEQFYQDMLCIPIDQRYDSSDMIRIIACLRSNLGKDNAGLKTGWMDWAMLEPYKSQLVELEFELMIKYHYPDWDIPRAYPEERVEALKEHMEKGNTFFWGVTKGNILVGYYWAYTVPFIDKKRWVLRSLLIQSEFQKHGLGVMAINEGLKKAREVGCDEAVTEYVPWNTSAARTYERAGYKISRIEVVKKIGAIKMDQNEKLENLGGYNSQTSHT